MKTHKSIEDYTHEIKEMEAQITRLQLRHDQEIKDLKARTIKQIEEWTNHVNWTLVNPYVMDSLIEAFKNGEIPTEYLGKYKPLVKTQ